MSLSWLEKRADWWDTLKANKATLGGGLLGAGLGGLAGYGLARRYGDEEEPMGGFAGGLAGALVGGGIGAGLGYGSDQGAQMAQQRLQEAARQQNILAQAQQGAQKAITKGKAFQGARQSINQAILEGTKQHVQNLPQLTAPMAQRIAASNRRQAFNFPFSFDPGRMVGKI